MSSAIRMLLGLLVLVAIVLVAIFVFDVGKSDNDSPTPRTVAVTTRTARATVTTRTTATTATGTTPQSQGAGVQEGPGSASSDATGAPGIVGLDLNDAGSQMRLTRPFAPSSPWNTDVSDRPTDSRSEALLRAARTRVAAVPQQTNDRRPQQTVQGNRALFINTDRWSVPIYTTQNGQATRLVCRQLPPYCGDGQDIDQLRIPPDAMPHPEYDGQFVVEDLTNGVAYAMFRARRGNSDGGQANVISYQFMRKWTLTGPGYQVPNSVSTIGSGLPSFAGVILPDEVKAGRIDHALAIAIPGPASDVYVQPASATDGVGSRNSIPEGARIRLKKDVKTPDIPGEGRSNLVAQKAIMDALRTYGAIVVERSKSPTLYAQMNFDWSQPMRDNSGRMLGGNGRPLPRSQATRANETPLLRGNELQGLTLDDFEVVQIVGERFEFPALSITPTAERPAGDAGAVGTPGTGTTPTTAAIPETN